MSNSDESNILDFSDDAPSSDEDSDVRLGEIYDPRPKEDAARRYIAYALIGLLVALIAVILLLVSYKVIMVSEIKEFSVILGPVVTLVSAATGFYYGTKS